MRNNVRDLRPTITQQARIDLLADISAFLIDEQLEISPSNLACAHAYATGSDQRLTQQITQRKIADEPITDTWLASLHEDAPNEALDPGAIHALGQKIDATMRAFVKTTRQAETETGEYKAEMANHVEQAKTADIHGHATDTRALAISQAMLETLRRIETSISQSQSETLALRNNLATAQSLANTDHLTELPNRRAFDALYDQQYCYAREHGTPLHVAICDVDRFKRINDTFGHQTGDNLLRAIAQTFAKHISGDCFVARHGGEEFAILFSEIGRDAALAQLEAARRELSERHFVARKNRTPIGSVTFSAGLADVMAAADQSDALAAADAALYQAKESGRNQIVVAEQ